MKLAIQIGFSLGMSLMMVSGPIRPVLAGGPYQINSPDYYHDEAAKWRQFIQREPKNPIGYLRLADLLLAEAEDAYEYAGDEPPFPTHSKVAEIYRQAIDRVGPHAELYYRLGKLLCGGGMNDKGKIPKSQQETGIAYVQKAISMDPNNRDYPIETTASCRGWN